MTNQPDGTTPSYGGPFDHEKEMRLSGPPEKRRRWMPYAICGGVFSLLLIVFTQVFTLLVIQPIGAVPDGRTVLIWRLRSERFSTNFIDSADAMCERIQGGVSLLCRGMVLGAIVEKDAIILRMPYSSTLYSFSTGGRSYDR